MSSLRQAIECDFRVRPLDERKTSIQICLYPAIAKKECNFKAVDGVLLDEFVVQQLSDLSDENSERFKDILEIKIEEVLEKSQTVQEHTFIKKKRDKLKADIAAQTRNLREAEWQYQAIYSRGFAKSG